MADENRYISSYSGENLDEAVEWILKHKYDYINGGPLNSFTVATPSMPTYWYATSGTYTCGGTQSFTVQTGYLGIIYYNGTTWSCSQYLIGVVASEFESVKDRIAELEWVKSISLSSMDSLYSAAGCGFYKVLNGSASVGNLFVFVDGTGTKIQQVFVSNYKSLGNSPEVSTTGEVTILTRYATLGTANSWGEWKDIISSSADKVAYDNSESDYQNINNVQDAIDKNASLIKEMQASVFPLVVTLTVLGDATREYTGENQSVNFGYTIKRQNQLVTPTRLTLTVNGVTTTISNPSASGTLTVSDCGKGTTSVSITAYYGSLNKSASASVSFIAPVLITNTPRNTMSSAELEQAQGWSVKSSAAGTYTMSPASDFYLWICVPAGKSITKVTSSGFDVPMERQSGNVSVQTVNGNEYEESYVCYRSSAKLIAGSWTFVVS